MQGATVNYVTVRVTDMEISLSEIALAISHKERLLLATCEDSPMCLLEQIRDANVLFSGYRHISLEAGLTSGNRIAFQRPALQADSRDHAHFATRLIGRQVQYLEECTLPALCGINTVVAPYPQGLAIWAAWRIYAARHNEWTWDQRSSG